MDEISQEKVIDLSKFDENDPREHQMKLLVGCGLYYGFRGQVEHTNLEVSNFTHGSFPSNHPFSGYDYFGIDGLLDKTHQLSLYKDRVRDTKDCMRVPIMDNDPTSSDFGGCIKRYLDKLAPGQTRIYCKVKDGTDHKGKTQYFHPNMPLGKHMISGMFKEAAKILGLPNPEKFTPHSLRAFFITRLANGNGVSDQERMDSSRHDSVGASAIYQERNVHSETNKFAALGLKPDKRRR